MPSPTERLTSWVATETEVQQRRDDARGLIGSRLERVRYVDIDYRQPDRVDGSRGARNILDPTEWADPTWAFPTCHSLDFGAVLEFEAFGSVAVGWEPPGIHEGLALARGGIELLVSPDANAAVWDVTGRVQWSDYTGGEVSDVDVHYKAWDSRADEGFWASRITLWFDGTAIDLILGEGRPDDTAIYRSADNLAVVFPGQALPEWED
jgi:hypothetical protein